MPRTIRDLMPMELEFQMFVLDELADELIAKGADVLKLTVGVPELPMPDPVLDTIVEKLHDRDFVRRIYPEGLPELRQAYARLTPELCRIYIRIMTEFRHNHVRLASDLCQDYSISQAEDIS